MAIDAIGASAADTQSSARTQLSDNYDTFLILLTAQLQNQDPLAPMDSTQFTQQLVQYSQVEQSIRQNEQLETLIAQNQAAAAGTALSYLGKDAIIESDTTVLAGGAANWAYNLDATAETVTISVRDASGREVFKADGQKTEGEHLFTWDGTKTDGTAAEDGVYRIVVTAKDANGEPIDKTINVREPIMGVDFSTGDPQVLTPSGVRSLTAIRSILDPI